MSFFNMFSTKDTDTLLLEMHKVAFKGNIEPTTFLLEGALAKVNIMLNRKNLRESLTQDEEIDYGLIRVKLEKMIDDLKTINQSLK